MNPSSAQAAYERGFRDAKDLYGEQNDMPTQHEVLFAMEKYGGSFAESLAKAWRCADSSNDWKLKQAFPELWDKYTKFALRDRSVS